jgi:DNA-binding NarL/FixJ family response regulator
MPEHATIYNCSTSREEEIASLVARGLTSRQIALELHISEHTAATHVRRILKRLV